MDDIPENREKVVGKLQVPRMIYFDGGQVSLIELLTDERSGFP
jgi:hypothetical protein